MTTPTSDERQKTKIDVAVFDSLEPTLDTWNNKKGNRLYRLSEAIGTQPAVYAITEYTVDINASNVNTVKDETILDIGALRIEPQDISSNEKSILDTLQNNGEQNNEFWNRRISRIAIQEFEEHFESKIMELVNGDITAESVIHDGDVIQFTIGRKEEAESLSRKSNHLSVEKWVAFLKAVQSNTLAIDAVYDENRDTNIGYALELSLEKVPDWRLRAVENEHCSVVNTATSANVAALMDCENIETQSEMATILGKSESTISERVTQVEEWLEQAKWTCKNR